VCTGEHTVGGRRNMFWTRLWTDLAFIPVCMCESAMMRLL
jgi:hypothetical protein